MDGGLQVTAGLGVKFNVWELGLLSFLSLAISSSMTVVTSFKLSFPQLFCLTGVAPSQRCNWAWLDLIPEML